MAGFQTRTGQVGGTSGGIPPNTPDTIYALERRAVVLASLPANVWTPVPKSSLNRIMFWDVENDTSTQLLTDSFEFRRNSGELEIKSIVALTNLQITIYGDFV